MKAADYSGIAARFPAVKLDGGGLAPCQGRVVFHQERLLRSTGGGLKAHGRYIVLCELAGLPRSITRMSGAQCVTALQCLETACRDAGLHHFRDIRTQWQELAELMAGPGGQRFSIVRDTRATEVSHV